MKFFKSGAVSFGLAALFFLSLHGHASAQTSGSYPLAYVSAQGNDSASGCIGPRPNTTFPGLGPCKTFGHALATLTDQGTIACASTGNFAPFNITQSVTIDCKAGGGGSNAGFVGINAPGKTIHLRNFTINGAGAGFNGIIINAAASVELDHVTIMGSNIGVLDQRTGPGRLVIRDSVISGSINSSKVPVPGLVVIPSQGSTLSAVLDHVIFRNNSYGAAIGGGARITITRSILSQNPFAGVEADGGAIIEINDSLISGNTTGVYASPGSLVSLSNVSIDSNNTGINGPTQSFGNNRLIRNASSDGTPPTPFGAISSENGQR